MVHCKWLVARWCRKPPQKQNNTLAKFPLAKLSVTLVIRLNSVANLRQVSRGFVNRNQDRILCGTSLCVITSSLQDFAHSLG